MDAHGMAHDSRTDHVTFDHVHHREIAQDDYCYDPALEESNYHTDGTRYQDADHRDEFHEEGQNTQQYGVWHMQHEHTYAYQYANKRCERELAPDVSAYDLIHDGNQELGMAPLCEGRLPP